MKEGEPIIKSPETQTVVKEREIGPNKEEGQIEVKAMKNNLVNIKQKETVVDVEEKKKGILDRIHHFFEPKYNEGRANRALAKGSREEWFYNDLVTKGKTQQAEQYKIALGKGYKNVKWNKEEGIYEDASITGSVTSTAH